MTELEKAQKALNNKIRLYVSIGMSVANSIVLSLLGTLTSGHFTIKTWLISLAISLGVSFGLSLLIPMKEVGEWVCRKFKTHDKAVKGRFLSGAACNLIMSPLMALVMTVTMVSGGIRQTTAARADLEAKITELTEQRDEKQAELDALETTHDTLQKEHDELQAQRDEKQAELDALKEGTADMTGEASVQSETPSAETPSVPSPPMSAIDNLTDAVDGMNEGLKKQENALTEQEGGIAALTSAIDGMNEGIEEQTKAHDSIVVPNMGKAILMSEIISNIAGLILNFLIQTPIVYGAASLAAKKKRLV